MAYNNLPYASMDLLNKINKMNNPTASMSVNSQGKKLLDEYIRFHKASSLSTLPGLGGCDSKEVEALKELKRMVGGGGSSSSSDSDFDPAHPFFGDISRVAEIQNVLVAARNSQQMDNVLEALEVSVWVKKNLDDVVNLVNFIDTKAGELGGNTIPGDVFDFVVDIAKKTIPSNPRQLRRAATKYSNSDMGRRWDNYTTGPSPYANTGPPSFNR